MFKEMLKLLTKSGKRDLKRCDFYRDMVEAQNKVDRWNLKEVVTENV